MDIQYGKPAESVKRFSFIKWVVAGILLVLLLLTWLAGADPTPDATVDTPGIGADAGAGSSGGAPASSGSGGAPIANAAAATSLAIDLAGDGSLKVSGTVPDEATRHQWLNAIRIGAQGAKVTDELRVGPVSPAAAGWTGQLSSLVAIMRESRLAGLRVDGDKVVLNGAVAKSADKGDVERMVQAQLPPGYRLDSRLAIGARATGPDSRTAAAGSTSPGASVAKDGGGGASTPDRAQADKLAQDAARPSPEAEAAKPARKPANCPRQLRPLAQPVYFKTDASTISSEDRARLRRLGECLGRARVRIVGHADPRHNDDYNQELSERRARAVAEALVAGGASESRVSTVGAGKAKTTGKSASRQALQRSRRVDIQIR